MTTEENQPVVVVGLVVAIVGLVAWQWLRSDTAEAASVAQAPSLNVAAARCAQGGAAAERAAQQRMSNARSQWERAVFDAELTAPAVRNARVAAACFVAAGSVERGRTAESIALGYERVANEDYAEQRLRLKIALGRGDVESARRAIERLRALLENQDSHYMRWLASVERQLPQQENAR